MGCAASAQSVRVHENDDKLRADGADRPSAASASRAGLFVPTPPLLPCSPSCSTTPRTPVTTGAGKRGWAVVRGYQKLADGTPNVRPSRSGVIHSASFAPARPMAAESRGAREAPMAERSSAGYWNWNAGRFALASPGGRSLRNAAMRNDVAPIRRAAAEGQDLDEPTRNGTTALVYAVQGDCLQAVKVLLELGADTEQQCEDGKVALHYAASAGHESVLMEMLRAGVAVGETVI